MADEDDLLRRYYANPALHPRPEDVNPWAVEKRYSAELRNPPQRPGDAMAPVAETISPTLQGYGMGHLLGDTYSKGSEGDWKGLAANLPELAMAVAPMPGTRGTTRGRRLDMSPEARAVRAAEMGFLPETYYHGTTHKFKEFAEPADPRAPYEPESHHGPAVYMSTSPSDARGNYAGLGPDLTSRIERRAENYLHDIDGDPARRSLAMRAKRIEHLIPDYWARDPESKLAWTKAHQELVGKLGDDGRMLELRTNMRNPVYVGGEKNTFFPLEMPEYRVEKRHNEFDVIDPHGDVVRSFPNEEHAWNHADELRYESEPSGPAARILELANGDLNVASEPKLLHRLQEEIMDNGGIKATTLESLVRNHYIDEMPPGQLLQNWYRDLGHDAAVLADADKQFPGMGIAPGTSHIALFDPRRVRDINAKFDPANIDSKNLMAGIAGAGGVGLTTADILRQYGDEKEKPDG